MVEKEPKLKTMTDAEKQTYMDRYGLQELKENPRGDISIVGFINDHEHWYFDFRVWNHLACSYSGRSVDERHEAQEQEKRATYQQRIELFENGRFLPVVFNTAGSAAPGAELFMKKLAQRAEDIGSMSFPSAMAYLRTRVSRLLARSVYHCIRGTHEKKDKSEFIGAVAFAGRRRGCAEVLPMHQRTDLGAVQDHPLG